MYNSDDANCRRPQATDICEGLGLSWLGGNDPTGYYLIPKSSCNQSPQGAAVCLCSLRASVACAKGTSVASIVAMLMTMVCAVAACRVARNGITAPSSLASTVSTPTQQDPNNPRLRVTGCGGSEFDGIYEPDGTKNGATRYRKIGGASQTINKADGSWYFGENYSSDWYTTTALYGGSNAHIPPLGRWSVGSNGRAPAPYVARVRELCAEAPSPPQSS
jgi:hypothetical protein